MSKRYLVTPVNDELPKKHYRVLTEDGTLVYDFDASLDFENPRFDAYADITRLGDAKLILTDDDGTVIPHRESDRFPETDEIKGGSFLRPAAHFTSRIGWNNDPNGLILVNGKYHMFYQHNPHSVNWGNMTWGHAVSDDLVHWEELGDILFPDETGTMFSGSAYCDHDNVSGLGKDAVLLFYTAAGEHNELSKGVPFSQCLAYSNDGGFTFTKYEKNPIIPHIIGGNRDPKVEWCPEIGRYTLALYLDGNEYALFASDNLLDWEKITDIHMEYDNECPDFYKLPVRGLENTEKWVFIGAHDTYHIGNMDSGTFTAEQSDLYYHRGPGVSYAAQTFSGTGDRRIKIAWDRVNAPGAVFNSQMGLPVEMFLQYLGGEIAPIRLGSYPVKEVGLLAKDSADITDGLYAADIELEIEDGCEAFIFSCFGMEIRIDPENNVYSHNGAMAPLSYTGAKKMRVIFDTLGAEIFADGGLIYSTIGQVADRSRGPEIPENAKVKVKVTALSME